MTELERAIAEVEREAMIRVNTYMRLVERGKLSEDTSKQRQADLRLALEFLKGEDE